MANILQNCEIFSGLDEPYSSASSNIFRKISAKPAQAVHFWRSWQASIKHVSKKKRRIALHF
jgi:hypothetical protein